MPTSAVDFDEKKIEEICKELNQCHLAGGAVGIAVGGRVVYRKGFGLANMELPVALSPSSRMRIYSTTKHFTCLAFLLLCEAGAAELDDTIGRHLPELNPASRDVTVRQLMGNIGGMRDAYEMIWQFSGAGGPISSAEVLSLYRDIDDVNFAPGSGWCYSNSGFLLIGAAIERITGRTLQEIFRTRIFEVVGMSDTQLRPFDADFVPNSATEHMTSAAFGYEKGPYIRTARAGEGGMVSTVDDMLRWLAHMDAPRVGNSATWAAIRTPQNLANGTSTGYGLGLITGIYRGVETVFHSGGGLGGNSQMLKVPEAGLDVVVMVNRHDISSTQLVEQILIACLPELDPVKNTRGGPALKGTFRSLRTGRVIQLGTAFASSWIRDGQQIATIDGFDYPFQTGEDGVLWPAEAASFLKMTITPSGNPVEPSSILFSDFGYLDELVSVDPAPNAVPSTIAGHYRSDATKTEATIVESTVGTRLDTRGLFGSASFRLNCLAEGIWQVKGLTGPMQGGGIILFDEDGAAFRFSSITTRLLPFRRCG